jgi:hypothetical protein
VKVPLEQRRTPVILTPRRRSLALPVPAALLWLAWTGSLALALAGVATGNWWLTPAAGVFVGALGPRFRQPAFAAIVIGAAAWSAPLAWLALSAPIGRTATVLAGILGLARLGAPVSVVLTALAGAILSLCGAWVGFALRSLKEG